MSREASIHVARQQIGFALDGLSRNNGHHQFEHLCRDLARVSVAPNLVPATGPVSAGGDRGWDFETFISFTTVEGQRRLAFACTLTRTEKLPAKIKSDVRKIMSGGSVDVVYAYCSADLRVAKRYELIDWAREAHLVELVVLDRQALAEQLAESEFYWIAQMYLHLPSMEVLTALAAAPPPTTRRPVRSLVGRTEELRHGTGLLTARSDSRRVVVVTGPPGVGKTDFALALVEAVADHFPDGQHLVEVATPGEAGAEADLVDLLAGVLDGGVVRPPESRRQQATRLRAQLAGRRVLLVVDNVPSEQALQDLLGVVDVAVLCTSRSRLAGLLVDGVIPVELGPLGAEDAAQLAHSMAPRLSVEESRSLAEVCGGLPLAVLIAAAQVRSRPQLRVEEYLARLADPDHGIEALAAGRLSMSAIIEFSYNSLGTKHADLLHVLGLLPGTTVPLEVIALALGEEEAELTDDDLRRTAQLLDGLYELHLVTQPEAEGYRLHDVLYRFARAKASSAARTWCDRVVRNGCLGYTGRTAFAARSIGFSDGDTRTPSHGNRQALAMLEATRVGALLMVELVCRAAQWERARVLAGLLVQVLRHLSHWDDLSRAARCIEQAGERTGHREWVAEGLLHLGMAESHRGNTDEAIALYRRSSEVAREVQDVVTDQAAYTGYGQLLLNLGHVRESIEVLRTVLRSWRLLGDSPMVAQTLNNLGLAHLECGELRKAEQYFRNSLEVARRAGVGALLPVLDTHLSMVLRLTGRNTEAVDHAKDALRSARAIGSREIEAGALLEIGMSHIGLTSDEETVDPLTSALRIFREIGDMRGQVTALRLIGVRAGGKDGISAIEALEECVGLALSMGDTAQGARAMSHVARISGSMGHHAEAVALFDQAVEIAESTGNALVVAEVREQEALLLRNTGRHDRAIASLRTSVSTLSKRGPSDELASVQTVLGEALIQNGQWEEAARVLRPIAESPTGTVHTVVRAAAFRHLATLYSHRELWDEAEHAARRAADLAEESGSARERMDCHATLGTVFARMGRWHDAKDQYDLAEPTAAALRDKRTMLTLRANQTTCSLKLGDREQAVTHIRRGIEIAAELGITDLEAAMYGNLGAVLAEDGQADEAIGAFTASRERAKQLGNAELLGTAEINLARAWRSTGDLDKALHAAHSARTTFQHRSDWSAAAKALLVELSLRYEDTASVQSTLAQFRASEPEVPAALLSAFTALVERKYADQPEPSGTAPSRGRKIHLAAPVRKLLCDIDCESLLGGMSHSRRLCFVCRLPIATTGPAELLAIVAPDAPINVTLTHPSCAPSAVVRSAAPVSEADQGRSEFECVLFSEDQAGIIVDCMGGLALDEDGLLVDTVLEPLMKVGFTKVQDMSDSAEIELQLLPSDEVAAHLDRDRLSITARGDALVKNMPLLFTPEWYRATRTGFLIAMFGRNLEGMTWEDEGRANVRRAAESGKLVAAMLRLDVSPPRRDSRCVCSPSTHRKYKRCCGLPASLKP